MCPIVAIYPTCSWTAHDVQCEVRTVPKKIISHLPLHFFLSSPISALYPFIINIYISNMSNGTCQSELPESTPSQNQIAAQQLPPQHNTVPLQLQPALISPPNTTPTRTTSFTITKPCLLRIERRDNDNSSLAQEEGEEATATTPTTAINIEFSTHLCSKRYVQDALPAFPDLSRWVLPSPGLSDEEKSDGFAKGEPTLQNTTNHTNHITTNTSLNHHNLHHALYAIPTYQQMPLDMTTFTDGNAFQKDVMLENVMFIAFAVHQKIQQYCTTYQIDPTTVFFDIAEPATGCPYFTTATSAVYNEVEGGAMLLRYRRHQSGQCCLLSHPRFHTSCYPTTFFFAGLPIEVLLQMLCDLGEVVEMY